MAAAVAGWEAEGISIGAGFIEGLSHPTDVLSTDIARYSC